jgi:hypothetical protein
MYAQMADFISPPEIGSKQLEKTLSFVRTRLEAINALNRFF